MKHSGEFQCQTTFYTFIFHWPTNTIYLLYHPMHLINIINFFSLLFIDVLRGFQKNNQHTLAIDIYMSCETILI